MAHVAAPPDRALSRRERPRSRRIDIWDVDLGTVDEPVEELLPTLSTEERERAAHLILSEKRRHFVLSHVLLRRVLARYVRIAPESLTFGRGPSGKPYLAGAALRSGVCFNISHSGARLLIGVTAGRPIGIDVEMRRTGRDALAIARRCFAPAEYERLAALSPDERDRAFLVCWTRKEAVVKAHGGGIGLGLADVATGFESIGTAGLAVPVGGESFRIQDLGGADYVGAVACKGGIDGVVRRTLP